MKIGILPDADNNNGWLEILPPLAPAVRATGEIKADYAVIGAGFTGLACARRLAELHPEAHVVLLEAGRIGNNAAGRSSGFAIDQAHNIRARDFAGNLQAERDQTSINRAGQDYLRACVQAYDIDCDWDEAGKIHAAATERGAAKLKAYSSNLDLLEADYRWLDAEEMQRVTGTTFYKTGLHTPGTMLMQPAALVLGLARSMPANVSVFEDSPVTELASGLPYRLITPEAEITAKTLVLANNGFAGQFGQYRKHLLPIVTWGSLTRPLTSDEASLLRGEPEWGIIPADPFGTSVRRIRGERILIRNIYSYNPSLNPTETDRQWARRRHEQSLRNRFPMLPDLSFDYTWGGPLCLSRNGEPVFGELGEDVFGAFCLNGVGIARGTAFGKLLAEHIAGQGGPLVEIMLKAGRPSSTPPEPFLGWGVRLNFAKRRYDAGLEL